MEPNNDTQSKTDDYADFVFAVWWNSSHNTVEPENSSSTPDDNSSDIYEPIINMCITWYSVTLVLGVMGNGLVIWIAGFRTKTVNAVWFLNLAIADFITCISLPLRIAEWALFYDIYYDNALCMTGISILFINMLCSVYFMTVISIDRCVSVFWPIWTKHHRTPRLATIISVLIWMLSLLISIPYLVFNHAFDDVTECFPKYVNMAESHTRKKRTAMFIIKNICMFAVPFAVILLSYILLFLKLRKIRKSKKSQRPFRVITTVIISFFICWFPYNTWPLITISDDFWVTDMVITEVCVCLAYFSSCINPILYILFSQEFKKNFVKSIPTMMEKLFNERSDIDCGVSTTTITAMSVNHATSVL